MPRRFERHARAKSDWGTPPARSAETASAASADPEPPKRAPARKDTRSWCKGKEGREHVPGLVRQPPVFTDFRECRWGTTWTRDTGEWKCQHRDLCAGCGKVLREPWEIPPGECPDYPGDPEQRAYAEQVAAQVAARAQENRFFRRPAITGPSHYRRKRAS